MDIVKLWMNGPVAWIEVNRPDKLNALNREALMQLRERIGSALDNAEARALVLTGAGERAFIAGADIAEMNALNPDEFRAMMELGKEVARLLERSPLPVLAAVNGYALGGGCELSLACDLVCASENAQFGLPEVGLGILPGWGGTQRLERRIGYGRARDMILTGRRVPAADALTWGLCDRVFPTATLRREVEALALEIAGSEGGALAAAKEALRASPDPQLQAGLRAETELIVALFDRPEREEAMRRFLQKRR